MRRIYRAGTDIVIEREKAAAGEVIRFLAYNVETSEPARTPAFRDEAERLCPDGYVLFEEGGRWFARPAPEAK